MAAPNHLTKGAGRMSNSLRTGILIATFDGFNMVITAITVMIITNVMAMRFKKAIFPRVIPRLLNTGKFP